MLGSCVVFAATGPLLAQVVPDGGTPTTITTATSGQITVNINPNVINPTVYGGISHNTYTQFSVPTAGVNLQNTGIGAGTIVNEVTSTLRSNINGPLEVLGPRAHVIIANPNGITVDGGSFINTGGVVLGAGSVSYLTRNLGGNVTVDNAVLSTSPTGDLLIEGAGLSGSMSSLHMLAHSMRIDGLVENTNVSPEGRILATAGSSSTEFDSTTIPFSNVLPWADTTDTGTTDAQVLVDITPQGSLSASKISIAVTEQGAGVSFAGGGYASAQDLLLNTKGHVLIEGADIEADRNVKIVSDSIEIINNATRQTEIEAVTGGVTMLATSGDLTNFGGAILGQKRDTNDTDSLGGVTLVASGNIEFRTESSDRRAIAFAATDDLYVEAGGDINNISGRLLSNALTDINAGGDLNNIVEIVDFGTVRGQYEFDEQRGKKLWYTLWSRRKVTRSVMVDYGDLAVPGELPFIVGQDVEIDAANVLNSGGEINANSGDLTVNTGTFTNVGEITGEYDFSEICTWYCRGNGGGQITIQGGKVNASNNININATTAIYNRAGQMLAVTDMNLNSPIFEAEGATVANAIKRPSTLMTGWSHNSAWLLEEKAGGLTRTLDGDINITTTSPVVLVDTVLDPGGTLNIPAGSVVVTTPNRANFTKYYSIGMLWKLIEDDS